jgi:hypothetical protein
MPSRHGRPDDQLSLIAPRLQRHPPDPRPRVGGLRRSCGAPAGRAGRSARGRGPERARPAARLHHPGGVGKFGLVTCHPAIRFPPSVGENQPCVARAPEVREVGVFAVSDETEDTGIRVRRSRRRVRESLRRPEQRRSRGTSAGNQGRAGACRRGDMTSVCPLCLVTQSRSRPSPPEELNAPSAANERRTVSLYLRTMWAVPATGEMRVSCPSAHLTW